MQKLVERTKGFVSQSPRAATVTAVSSAVAIASVALLLAGVRTGGAAKPASTPPRAVASVVRQPCGTVAPAVMPSRFCQYTLESAFGVRANWRQ
jgi:hypothetical protein